MKILTKENLEEFMIYYHDFHDSFITNVNYDVKGGKIEVFIDVYWSGEPLLKANDVYETNPKKLRILLYGVEKANNKEIFCDIDCAYLKYIKYNGKDLVCFADNYDNPDFYVVCDKFEYEEV